MPCKLCIWSLKIIEETIETVLRVVDMLPADIRSPMPITYTWATKFSIDICKSDVLQLIYNNNMEKGKL